MCSRVFTGHMGGSIVVLPIALAALGPRSAVAAVAAMGLATAVTMLALTTATVRSSATLTSSDRLGRLVGQRFGARPAAVTLILVTLNAFGVVVVQTLGLGGTLSEALGGQMLAWTTGTLLIVAVIVLLRLERVFLVGAGAVTVVSLILLAVLIVMLTPHVDSVLLNAAPLISDGDISLLAPAYGALIGVFAGNTIIASISPSALRDDPSGRSLVYGAIAGIVLATTVYAVWTLVTLGSIPAEAYLGQESTGLRLLRPLIGVPGEAVATVFVVLLMSMAILNYSGILTESVSEGLPTRRSIEVALTPGVVVEGVTAGSGSLTVTVALAPGGRGIVARVSSAGRVVATTVVGDAWDSRQVTDGLDGFPKGRWLSMERLGSGSDGPQVRIASSMPVRVHHVERAGIDLLMSDDSSETRLLAQLVREPRSLLKLAEDLAWEPRATEEVLARLAEGGAAQVDEAGIWRANLGYRHAARGAGLARLSAALTAEEPTMTSPDVPKGRESWLASAWVARAAPAAVMLLALITLVSLVVSEIPFADATAILYLVTGIYFLFTIPILLGMASARRRDQSGPSGVWLPSNPLLGVLLVLPLAIAAVYAIVIYTDWVGRTASVGAIAISVATIVWAVRSGAMRPGSVLVVDVDEHRKVTAHCTDGGREVRVECPPLLPAAGGQLVLVIPEGLRTPLRVVTRSGDVAPPELGWMRVAWQGGTTMHDATQDISGLNVPITNPSGPLKITWLTC